MKYKLFIFFVFISFGAFSQKELSIQLTSNYKSINNSGLYFLGGWAASNIIFGGIKVNQTTTEQKYFHQMNIMWNTLNLGLAGIGLINSSRKNLPTDETDFLKTQLKTERIFLINSGLDLVYISTGFILNNQIEKKPQLNGYGKSLILQGSFLLIFDGLMFALNRRNRKIFLSPNFGSTQLNIGVSVRY